MADNNDQPDRHSRTRSRNYREASQEGQSGQSQPSSRIVTRMCSTSFGWLKRPQSCRPRMLENQ